MLDTIINSKLQLQKDNLIVNHKVVSNIHILSESIQALLSIRIVSKNQLTLSIYVLVL